MICNVIATGSTGNAVTINEYLLVDCGVPFATLEPYYKKLRLVLLTHIHSDHFNPATIKRLHFLRPALRFAVPPWLSQPMHDLGVDHGIMDIVIPSAGRGMIYQNGLLICNQRIPHDTDNCCWHIQQNRERAFYATDCGTLDGIEARNYDLYMVEANYDEDELAEREARKLSAGEFSYESRAATSHLSTKQVREWLADNAEIGRSKVVYLHQHIEREESYGSLDSSLQQPDPSSENNSVGR